jgi:hypothetical protein
MTWKWMRNAGLGVERLHESAFFRQGASMTKADALGLVALWTAIGLFGSIGIAIVALPVLLWKLRQWH